MADHTSILEWFGLSGIVAGIGAAVGYGRLNEKVEAHAKEMAELRKMADTAGVNAGANNQLLIRLDERMSGVREELAEIKAALKQR